MNVLDTIQRVNRRSAGSAGPVPAARHQLLKFHPLTIADSYEILMDPYHDDRGYFMRTFDDSAFRSLGLATEWVEESESLSERAGLIRGLHFQRPPYCETKLVRVAYGAVLDVLLDLRPQSPTYGRWESVELSDARYNMVYVPKGCAHGFCTLTDRALVLYKMDTHYAPQWASGVRWNDPAFDIRWPVSDPYLSPKDAAWPLLADRRTPPMQGIGAP